MDWTELSNRLADGAKIYKAFQDGANSASMLGGFERANAELSAQYDTLVRQVEQTKATLQAEKDEIARTRTAADQDLARQQAVWETTHAKQVEAAQAELTEWQAKVVEQMQTSQKQAQWYQAQITQWEGALAKLQDQVKFLEQIKASLKSQLQGVV